MKIVLGGTKKYQDWAHELKEILLWAKIVKKQRIPVWYYIGTPGTGKTVTNKRLADQHKYYTECKI